MFPGSKRLSASARVALAVTAVLAIGVLLLAGIGYVILSRQLDSEMDRTLSQETSAFVAAVESDPVRTREELEDSVRSYLARRTAGERGAATIQLIRFADGRVISNSDVNLEDAPANEAALAPATAGSTYMTLRYEGEEYRAATTSIMDADGGIVAVFQVAVPTDEYGETAAALLRTLLIAGGLVVLLAAAFSSWIARTTLRPLHEVSVTTEEITQSSLSTRVPYDGPEDDIGRMVSALNEMLDRLERAFAELRHFTADASHELRTPLTVIRGHLEVMRYEAELTPSQEESLYLVLDEVGRMTRLVEDLLSLARLESGREETTERVDLSRVAEEGVTRMKGVEDRDFAVDCDGDVAVRGNRDMLLQVVLNLLSNAVSATEEGGSVHVRCGLENGAALLHVDDDGPGIDPEDMPRIFDRFHRAKVATRGESGGGSGLGLTIASRIVERHGGRLAADRSPLGGARFTLELPAIREV